MSHSAIAFREAASGRPVAALERSRIHVSSRDLGWDGLAVEVGENDDWDVSGLATADHYLAVHLGGDGAHTEFGPDVRPRRVELRPGGLWLSGAGRPFSWRVQGTIRYAALAISPGLAERLAGVEGLDVRTSEITTDPVLAHLVQALAAEAEAGGANGPAFAQSVAALVARHLARQYGGRPSPGASDVRALDRRTLRRVLGFVEANLERGVTLEAMAAQAALSPFHFARAFKAALGVPPYRYVQNRRTERARELLLGGERRAGEVARELGFADPSHLTRAFKKRYGLTPRQFVKEAAR